MREQLFWEKCDNIAKGRQWEARIFEQIMVSFQFDMNAVAKHLTPLSQAAGLTFPSTQVTHQIGDPHPYSQRAFELWAASKSQPLQRLFDKKIPTVFSGYDPKIFSDPDLVALLGINLFLNISSPMDSDRLRAEMMTRIVQHLGDYLFARDFLIEGLIILSTRLFARIRNGNLVERGRAYFEKYCACGERWVKKQFFKFLSRGKRAECIDPAESAVISMLSYSRSFYDFYRTDPSSGAFGQSIYLIDQYFQQAFRELFNFPPPVNLSKVTNLIQGNGGGLSTFTLSCAEVVRMQTYIQPSHYFGPEDVLNHIILHEGLHLCVSPEDDTGLLEEGYIELVIERMMKRVKPSFDQRPFDNVYMDCVRAIEELDRQMKGFIDALDQYFIFGEKENLITFLKKKYTKEIESKSRLRLEMGAFESVFAALENLTQSF